MASCNVCQMQGLEWSENVGSNGKHYLYNPNTGQKHVDVCKPQLPPQQQPKAIPLYVEVAGISYKRTDGSIALSISNEEMRCGIAPGKARLERKGDFIIIH